MVHIKANGYENKSRALTNIENSGPRQRTRQGWKQTLEH